MILYELEPAQAEYLIQEDVNINLRIQNQGAAAVVVPDPTARNNEQPVFGLIGPAPMKPVLFSNWNPREEGQAPPPLRTIIIAPGETWRGQSPLNRLTDVSVAGDYRISSMLAWQGGNVRSSERSFRVNRPEPVSLHVGQGARPFDQGEGQLVLLQKEANATGVYALNVKETDPSNSEMYAGEAIRRATAGPTATDIMCQWKNSPLFSELLQWIVWREGRSLKALSSAEVKPASIDLPVAPDLLVHPPLKTDQGPVEILALHGRTLYLVSVPPKLQASPVLSWQGELPAVPVSITSILGPADQGSLRHLAFVTKQADSIEIFHGQYTPSGLGHFERVSVPGGSRLENASLTLAITGDGVAHVGVLRSTQGGKGLAVVEAQFGAGAAPRVEVQPLPAPEKPVTEGAVQFVVTKGTINRRDVAIRAEGQVWNLTKSGQFRKLEPPRAFTSPLLIVPGLDLSYVLYQGTNGGFQFQPFHR